MSHTGKILAVIPAFNEEDRISNTIKNIREIDSIDEIVIVDDGSTDRTTHIAKNLGTEVITLGKNYGKGYAIRKAISMCKFDYLILLDGDLGDTSRQIEKLIYPIINNEADFTIARFKKPNKKGGFGLVKNLAKYGVYIYTGVLIDTSLSGQRVYKKEVIDSMIYIPDRFGVEVAMTVAALRNKFNIKEVDVDMTHRESGRDLRGFIHRGKQFFDIIRTLIILSYRR